MENFIEFFKQSTKYDLSNINIYFSDNKDFAAYASETSVEICVGVFTFSYTLENKLFKGAPSFDNTVISCGAIASNITLFVIAHELFHATRGHFGVLSKHGREKMEALEYDADCLAAETLYRYIERRNKNMHSLIIKKIAVFCIFIPLYYQAISSVCLPIGSKSHPSWHHRIFYITVKIANIDNDRLVLNTYSENGMILIKFLIDIEKYVNGIEADQKPSVLNFIRDPELSIENLIEMHDDIIPDLIPIPNYH